MVVGPDRTETLSAYSLSGQYRPSLVLTCALAHRKVQSEVKGSILYLSLPVRERHTIPVLCDLAVCRSNEMT